MNELKQAIAHLDRDGQFETARQAIAEYFGVNATDVAIGEHVIVGDCVLTDVGGRRVARRILAVTPIDFGSL